MTIDSRISRRHFLAAAAASGLSAPALVQAQQELREVRIAKQFGISYLPLLVMEDKQMLERRARAAGLGDVRVQWLQFAGGAPINDALIGGNLEFAGGGVGPMITLWARTRTNLRVRGVAAINSMPLYLNTVNPNVRTLRDFTERDRIALPAVRVSIQAVTLQMACEQAFGAGQHGRLDNITVSMSHPDATSAMLSGRSEITAHFGSPPFQNQQLRDNRARRVLSSYEVLGGPSSFNFMWTTTRVREQSPKTYRAFFDALNDSLDWINANTREAAELYIRMDRSNLPLDFVEALLNDPDHEFTLVPKNTMKYAEFMARTGTATAKPDTWKDLFFPELHGMTGS
ncbi:MAG: ABC transporter substrate-binding protein [Alphaproteobacteria bacterium]|nr:ABC transporter substrate-binding protein [Alphaproteobacteria bacterium]